MSPYVTVLLRVWPDGKENPDASTSAPSGGRTRPTETLTTEVQSAAPVSADPVDDRGPDATLQHEGHDERRCRTG